MLYKILDKGYYLAEMMSLQNENFWKVLLFYENVIIVFLCDVYNGVCRQFFTFFELVDMRKNIKKLVSTCFKKLGFLLFLN